MRTRVLRKDPGAPRRSQQLHERHRYHRPRLSMHWLRQVLCTHLRSSHHLRCAWSFCSISCRWQPVCGLSLLTLRSPTRAVMTPMLQPTSPSRSTRSQSAGRPSRRHARVRRPQRSTLPWRASLVMGLCLLHRLDHESQGRVTCRQVEGLATLLQPHAVPLPLRPV